MKGIDQAEVLAARAQRNIAGIGCHAKSAIFPKEAINDQLITPRNMGGFP
jgi:hypothetical protein